MPNQRKGVKKFVEISAVAWLDLLGYGAMLRKSRFDPSKPESIAAVERLTTFHSVCARNAHRTFTGMLINDGAVFFKDLSARTNFVTYDFLRRSIQLFQSVQTQEFSMKYPGARMIIAVGPRVRLDNGLRFSSSHLRSLSIRLEEGKIPVEQALNEAFQARPICGYVPDLQANFAFTKAYLADQGGKKAGFPGPNCYIDMSMFSIPEPRWIKFDNLVSWQVEGMSGTFARLQEFQHEIRGPSDCHGIRNAIEIADALGVKRLKSHGVKRLKSDYLFQPTL